MVEGVGRNILGEQRNVFIMGRVTPWGQIIQHFSQNWTTNDQLIIASDWKLSYPCTVHL